MYEDYFDIKLNDGRTLLWKNFGQVITLDDEDLRKKPIAVEGDIVTKDRFKDIEVLEDYHWFINAKKFQNGEGAGTVIFRFPADEIVIMINCEFQTRLEEYPERDYFYWLNEYRLYNDFKEMIGVDENKAIEYLNNWRRPKLKTNGEVKAIVYHNSEPIYVAILNGESRKSVVDAFFRKIYYLKFLHGE